MPDKPRRKRVSSPSAPPGARLIRKYGNRRLYDTGASKYVTLEDLVEVFGGEADVRVVDAVSGEDLTKKVLAQAILFEEDRTNSQIIPLELLRSLLRHRGANDDMFQRKVSQLLVDLERSRKPGGAPAETPPDELAELRRRLKALESQFKKSK